MLGRMLGWSSSAANVPGTKVCLTASHGAAQHGTAQVLLDPRALVALAVRKHSNAWTVTTPLLQLACPRPTALAS